MHIDMHNNIKLKLNVALYLLPTKFFIFTTIILSSIRIVYIDMHNNI